MGIKLNYEQKGRLGDRLAELRRVTANGTRDYDWVMDAVQSLIDGKYSNSAVTVEPSDPVGAVVPQTSVFVNYPDPTLPSWYVSPELRLEVALRANRDRGWGFAEADFPSLPEGPGVWLLAIKLARKGRLKGLQRTFDDRWDLITGPKWRDPGLKSDSEHLCLAPGYEYVPGVQWVPFDPNGFAGLSPTQALSQSTGDLAGTEVLDAAWQFPEWKTCWFRDGNVAPNMSALQYRWSTAYAWAFSPCLYRVDAELNLYACSAGYADPHWGSPRLRGVL